MNLEPYYSVDAPYGYIKPGYPVLVSEEDLRMGNN